MQRRSTSRAIHHSLQVCARSLPSHATAGSAAAPTLSTRARVRQVAQQQQASRMRRSHRARTLRRAPARRRAARRQHSWTSAALRHRLQPQRGHEAISNEAVAVALKAMRSQTEQCGSARSHGTSCVTLPRSSECASIRLGARLPSSIMCRASRRVTRTSTSAHVVHSLYQTIMRQLAHTHTPTPTYTHMGLALTTATKLVGYAGLGAGSVGHRFEQRLGTG